MTELISTPWKKDGYLLVRTHQGPPELVKQAVEQDYLRYHPVGYGTWARWDMMIKNCWVAIVTRAASCD